MQAPTVAEQGLRESEKSCRLIARSHYENFLVASVLLPRKLRQPFYNVYAFCRTADDLADESGSPQVATQRLSEFQQQLDATFQDKPPEGPFLALHDTIRTFSLDKRPFDDLLSAFRQDQEITDYQSTEQLIDYCSRSANPVGRIVLQLAGSLSDETALLSDEICTGLQLANFWQDVARDHEIGRVYLPADARERFHVERSMLELSSTPSELRALLAELCDDAERRFRAGLPLADLVPRWLAADIRLFAHGGLATLHAIRKIDFDVLRRRPTVSKAKQLWLVASAATGLLR